jgi:xanthine dehydrogenase small subunit
VRLAYGGVAATPVRVTAAEDGLVGAAWDEAAVGRAQEAVSVALRPLSDHRGSAEYRRRMSCELIEKFALECRA